MAQEFKAGIIYQMVDIGFSACKTIIHTDHLVSPVQQFLTQMGA